MVLTAEITGSSTLTKEEKMWEIKAEARREAGLTPTKILHSQRVKENRLRSSTVC